MKKKGKSILDSKSFVRYTTLVLFLLAGLLTAIIFGSNTQKQSLANNASRLEGIECPEDEPDCEDGPIHIKDRKSNGDGTYNLSLTVVGEAEKQVPRVNVIVIVDRSGSMDTQSGTGAYVPTTGTGSGLYGLIDGQYVQLERRGSAGNRTFWYNGVQYTGQRYQLDNTATRMQATQNAVNKLADSLLGYNGKDDNPNDTVQMALISFATNARTDVANTTSKSTFESAVNNLDADGGTNWEAALQQANTIDFGDTDPTFVIFFSDGSPTFHATDGGYSNWNNTYRTYGSGQEQEPNMERSYTQAVDDAAAIATKYGVENFYTIFAYGTTVGSNYMASLTTEAGAPSANNYSASSTAALQDAFDEILEKIEMIGITNVSMVDGTTANVATSSGISHLLEVDATSFKYYKDGDEWADAPAATYDDKEYLDELDAEGNKQPNPHYGAVDWDLSSVGVLEDGVEYKVTFDVYPSQETYDLIADLRNGTRTYESLPAEVRKYLSPGPNYTLETNTYAELTYSDTRPDTAVTDKVVSFNKLDGAPLTASEIKIEKIWEHATDLDRPYAVDEDGNPVVLDMYLKRDGVKTNEKITVTKTDDSTTDWKDTKHIATGLLRTKTVSADGNSGTLQVLDSGHDYTLEEPSTISYHWELTMETTHPMIIDNELTTLVEVTGDDIPSAVASDAENTFRKVDGETYYKFSFQGSVKVYRVKAVGTTAELKAYNNRKSYIEFKKELTDASDAPEGKQFNFTFTVNNVIGSNETDSDVWFSIFDTKEGKTVLESADTSASTLVSSDKGVTREFKDGEYTGYYYVPNNSLVSIKVQEGWNIRIINLGTTSTYTITEKDVVICAEEECTLEELESSNPKYFNFEKIEPSSSLGPDTSWVTSKEGTTISGKVTEPDTSYSIVYTNEYPGTYVTATKEWIGEVDPSITEVEVELYQKVGNEEATSTGKKGKITKQVDEEGNVTWKPYTFEGLPLRDADNNAITYSVKEKEIAGYTSSVSPKDNHTWVVTNIEKTDLIVTKVWDDANNQDGKRPTRDLTFILKDGSGNVIDQIPEKITDTEDNKDYYKYTDLAKYDSNGNLIAYTVTETVPTGYTVSAIKIVDGQETEVTGANAVANAQNSYTLTNKYIPEVINVTVEKDWADGFNQDGIRPEKVEVTLYQQIGNGEVTSTNKKVELTEDNDPTTKDWTYTFENLPRYSNGQEIKYTVQETITTVLTGEDKPGEYAINNGGVVVSEDGTIKVTNTHTPEKVAVEATKVWDDANNQDGIQPPSIEFVLSNNKTDETIAITLDGAADTSESATGEKTAWKATWANLPKYYEGAEITYYVDETTTSVITGKEATDDTATTYKYAITGDYKTGFTITNTHTPQTTKVTVEKDWDDNDDQDALRSDVVATVTLYKSVNGGAATPVKDAQGNNLTATVGADDNWSHVFEGLPVNEGGKQITYSIQETLSTPAGYENTEITDPVGAVVNDSGSITVTNYHEPAVTEKTATKIWDDANNQDNSRPEAIQFQLYADGEKALDENGEEIFGILTANMVDNDGNWTYTWSNLPKYAGTKDEIVYTVIEVTDLTDNGYTKSEDGLTVTNTRTPDKTQVTVKKTWDDNDNQDALRSDVVATVTLYKSVNGREPTPVKDAQGNNLTATVGAADNWSHVFANLPVNEGGKQITYSIQETLSTPAGYENTDITDPVAAVVGNSGSITVTNYHEPAVTEKTATKIWEDSNNQDGKRPQSIQFQLYADGEKALDENGNEIFGILDANTHDEDGNWTYTWTNLPKFNKSKTPIVYTVKEVTDLTTVGYAKPVEDGLTITNSRTTENISLTVEKDWDDQDNQDGIQPTEVEIKLYSKTSDEAEPTLEETFELSAENDWSKSWATLPKYRGGKLIVYSVVETKTSVITESTDGPGTYDADDSQTVTENDGVITVTNTHTPEITTATAHKTWDDDDDRDGIQPETVILTLYKSVNGGEATPVKDAQGNKVTVTLSEANNWADTVTGLPKYAGTTTPIKYTFVEERENIPEGYTPESSQDGLTIKNKHIPDKTNVTVKKVWDDSNNQDGVRENVIAIVTLYKSVDGGTPEIVTNEKDEPLTATVGAADNWSHVFEGLPVREDGKVITYSIDETFTDAQGYTKESITDPYVAVKDGNGEIAVTNSRETDETQVTVKKTWDDNKDQDGARANVVATVTLYKSVDGGEATPVKDAQGNNLTATVGADDNWSHVFEGLPVNEGGKQITYSIQETLSTPAGYEPTNITAPYAAVKDGSGEITVTNYYEPEKTSITFHKGWDDNDNQDGLRYQDTYEITLHATTEDGDVELPANIQTVITIDPNVISSYTWTGLPVYNSGKEITYTIEETREPEGYKADGLGTSDNKYTITNYHKPEVIEETVVTKIWDDESNRDGIRPPSITLILKGTTESAGTFTVNATQPTPVKDGNTWTYTYTNLDKYKNGEKIEYTITEDLVDGYEGTPDGLTITNYHEPEKIKIPVTKQWVDANDQDGKRPDKITVELYADGDYKDSIVLSAKEGDSIDTPWVGEFTGLPKYREGKVKEEIEYTIKEVSDVLVAEEGEDPLYEGTIDGFDIVNEHIPSKKTISGQKIWDDDDNRDGIRPTSITINLLVNGEVIQQRTLPNKDGSWTFEFDNLPEYENGKVIPYQIDEEGVTIADDAYSKTVDNGNYTITNSHKPAEISISGNKVWSDADDQDGLRPDSITVNLMTVDEKGNKTPAKDKDGKAITKEVQADAEGNWGFTFTGLPKFEHGKVGKEIKYAVTEETVDGYTADIPEGSYTITNKHTPAQVTYIVSKDWDDEKNNDGIRPDSVTVKLLADGKVKETVKLSNANNWTHTFGPMDKNKGGKEISYTIEEEAVPGYKLLDSKPVVENETITRVLTNQHTPEKTSISGNKTWIDENNKNGKRPETITVYVYGNGELIATIEVSKDSNWEYALDNLYKFKNGVEIEYTIKEKEVEGYDTEYDGFNIINIETEVEGETEEFPPDTFAKDQNTYKLDLLTMLIGGMVLTIYRRVIKA